ncbi:phosphoribosylformylglycinamidine synthase [Chloropicon primus]|uniref:phosphoribosylformylglycinamidine synthase n=1 Tax=Chloropicon primus TaxID=1764295 RepID=A0A5B8MH19_9CHLO|nr:phosphoribosylformylglycinamidine synthase [Chloropicon primus]|eukprot:QDZ18995.1 phosphoribosylformylglycinamidine synthase [Chloropicon primus]
MVARRGARVGLRREGSLSSLSSRRVALRRIARKSNHPHGVHEARSSSSSLSSRSVVVNGGGQGGPRPSGPPDPREVATRAVSFGTEGRSGVAPATLDALISAPAGRVFQLYRTPLLSGEALKTLLAKARAEVSPSIESIEAEACFNLEVRKALDRGASETVLWLLGETFELDRLTHQSAFGADGGSVVEVGPRMSFSTAWCSNAVSIFKSCGLEENIGRTERSSRFRLTFSDRRASGLTAEEREKFAELVHDRMTEQVYERPLESFESDVVPAPVLSIPVIEEGRKALEDINEEMGLAFDDWDIDYYMNLFCNEVGRNPTNVELFDLGQSNSEHSRHWFFKGDLTVDGKKKDECLFDIVEDTLKENPGNSVIAFKDNSSAIKGFKVNRLEPSNPGEPSPLEVQEKDYDILFTAETHNFPCAVAPYPGAETGAGGRMRDTHATGIGSLLTAGTAGYCVGNLHMDNDLHPWEDGKQPYPESLASPLQILIDASNGASDYGNKFGEPLIQGYTRTFGQRLPNGERREWLKPIMFSAGIGQINHQHLEKSDPEVGMLVVKIGGPAYRIGMGGGAASSLPSGSNKAELDFNAVQRGDGEFAQKLYRVAKACVEMGEKNPIVSIHDQGAGGNCNCVKEIIYPLGAEIDIREIKVGDETMSVLEIWGAEYQENDCLLIKPESRALLEKIAERERCLVSFIGVIKGDGKIVLKDRNAAPGDVIPEDLDLDKVLGKMPRKKYDLVRDQIQTTPLDSGAMPFTEALHRVLRLPSVCSKRFLTTKVDRSVSGLVAQQQCVGPLQLPLADVAVVAQTFEDVTGGACSIGEQPLKGMLNPSAMARLAVAEAVTNIMWAPLTSIEDIKSSVNWMYAAKMDGEGAAMYDAAVALRDSMISLGIACDGGKDSLSMAASAGGEVVKAPGNLVVSAYCTCSDITKVVTPDLKRQKDGVLLHVDLAHGKRRLGGSAYAQVNDSLGDAVPDVDNMGELRLAFEIVQSLIYAGKISAGHDISDGGLVTTLLEMAFAGNCGMEANFLTEFSATEALFAEEPGFVLEVSEADQADIMSLFGSKDICCEVVGRTSASNGINISVNGEDVVKSTVQSLRDVWEQSAFELEKLQCADVCVENEAASLSVRKAPLWNIPYTPELTRGSVMKAQAKHKVAIIREEGSNGDREMAAAFHAAGFEAWDISMSDMLSGKASLESFRGIAFVGGFSYADVLDSAKGWAGGIRFNKALQDEFKRFYERPDTFSLGVCNGCQLMALLGWVPGGETYGDHLAENEQPRFVHNVSGRFESRWSNVTIKDSPAVMLKGMEGLTMGIWVAHGEGRAHFPDASLKEKLEEGGCFPIRYCDDDGLVSESYPSNPNGSPEGIASICSPDGRHLALMPHPERCFLNWQLPWYPSDSILSHNMPSPWLKLFQNAREWCDETFM